ncbi:MAG: radical SAM protein, partial [Muribaculaceae bacterium]
MQTVMYTHTIFGPIHSRRLGTSLGVNLMPNDGKICSFDCLYCEAGYNAQGHGSSGIPSRAQVARLLEAKLAEMHAAGQS